MKSLTVPITELKSGMYCLSHGICAAKYQNANREILHFVLLSTPAALTLPMENVATSGGAPC
jgi:hypothetical protein